MRLRLLDLDGSVVGQEPFRAAAQAGRAQVVDLRAEGPGLRLWASRRQMAGFGRMIGELPAPPGEGLVVSFLGSGDYHHLSGALIAAGTKEPVTVLHFDNHPDWVRLPPAWHCGSWINRVLELPQVARVITIGVCANDLDSPQRKGGNVGALADGRIEMHPWCHRPSQVWGRVGSGPGRRRDGRHLIWDNLAGLDWSAFLDALLARLPTEAVWVTIDKDVLSPEDAVTNWDQGEMPLDALLLALKRLCRGTRVLGIDVCGEFSPPIFGGWLKRLSAWADQPRAPLAPDLSRNVRSNRRLLDCLAEVA